VFIQKQIFTFLYLVLLTNFVFASNETIRVVTSFSVLEDLVNELGGDHISVVNLVGRDSDAHMYQPIASDAVAIAKADLVIFNGLGFEGWMSRLLDNAEYKQKQLDVSTGVVPIRVDGEVDPHAWQSFKNIRIYIDNITHSLIETKPVFKNQFLYLQKNYIKRLDQLEAELVKKISSVPQDKRSVVTSHDAFGYLAKEYDIEFIAPLGLSLESEASARDVAKIIDQIRRENVTAIFLENISNPRLLRQISDETDVAIGGSLYSDALSHKGGPADTYLNMMKHNIESLTKAFNSK